MSRFRVSSVVFGLILIGIAIGIYWYTNYNISHTIRAQSRYWFLDILFTFIPTFIFAGLVITIRGIIWGARIWSGRNILITGLIMLVIGAFPWIYTPLLMGARKGSEGPGMLGTLIFLFVGIPGLIFTIFGFICGGRESDV
jgi:hypothetical protein